MVFFHYCTKENVIFRSNYYTSADMEEDMHLEILYLYQLHCLLWLIFVDIWLFFLPTWGIDAYLKMGRHSVYVVFGKKDGWLFGL